MHYTGLIRYSWLLHPCPCEGRGPDSTFESLRPWELGSCLRRSTIKRLLPLAQMRVSLFGRGKLDQLVPSLALFLPLGGRSSPKFPAAMGSGPSPRPRPGTCLRRSTIKRLLLRQQEHDLVLDSVKERGRAGALDHRSLYADVARGWTRGGRLRVGGRLGEAVGSSLLKGRKRHITIGRKSQQENLVIGWGLGGVQLAA